MSILQKLVTYFPKKIKCVLNRTPQVILTIDHKFSTETFDDKVDDDYLELWRSHANECDQTHTCLVLHPYVKWGRARDHASLPERRLQEATDLVHALPGWRVQDSRTVPLLSLRKQQLFGSGTLDQLRSIVRQDHQLTAVYIDLATLQPRQRALLQDEFGLPVLDRYSVVMQILRAHATSGHARLQVSLAEIPYLRARLRLEGHANGYAAMESALVTLERRQRILLNKLERLRQQRVLLRNKRRSLEYPIVAVVGYTNAGKTSLIKALTGDQKLEGRDQPFATLDVTVHEGVLPSGMRVLYTDTVGFIANIPHALIECFVATLEDVLLADVILHVQDLASEDLVYQGEHVERTLAQLSEKSEFGSSLFDRIIRVGNKTDKAPHVQPEGMLRISATQAVGLEDLREAVEKAVIRTTGNRLVTIRLATGADELRWLYKNASVLGQMPDPKDPQFQHVRILISHASLQKFYAHFIAK